ncbi:MAG TPA: HlyD family efflux transporter periplasmic adaptor subunit, partial [Propionibacterium sp.]|nr:HlyD family efflux transporter periplasmic adaptor subunit [Propionibacterium sp.]
QVAAARAGVESADASVVQALAHLADAQLTSPLAGVVAAVNIEVGDQVSGAGGITSGASLPSMSGLPGGLSGIPGMAALPGGSTSGNGGSAASGAHIVVVVPDAWKLEAEVGTADLPHLQTGQEAVVTPTGTSQHVAAVVDTVGIVATAASGQAAMFPVTLRVTDPSATLFSGSDADAVVTTGTVRDVLTVPGEAIWITNGKPTVRRQQGGSVTMVEVETGRRFGDRVEILSGLAEGDEVLARRSVVVTPPPRPQFGPGGSIVSPDPTATPER